MTELVIGASTFSLLFQPWRQATSGLLASGFRAIELFCDAPQAHYTQLDTGDRRALRELAAKCELSVHAPVFELNLASGNPCSRDEAVRQYREAVYLVAEIGAARLVVHEGHRSYWKLNAAEARGASASGLRELLSIARQVGVTVALENTNFGKQRMYDTWEEWAGLAVEAAGEAAGMPLVLDTGHAHLAGWDLAALVRGLGSRIVQMHVHDTGGQADDHLVPGEGVIDWPALAGAIRQSGTRATLILEDGPHDDMSPLVMGRSRLEAWLRG